MTVSSSFNGRFHEGIGYSKDTVDLNGTRFAEIRKVTAYCITYEIKSINGSV